VLRFAGQLNVTSGDFPLVEPPALPSIHAADFDAALAKNLALCSIILDFSNPNVQIPHKAAKRTALADLSALFERDFDVSRMTLPNQALVFEMLHKNIFDQDPSQLGPKFQLDYSVSVVEPAWPHMTYCFEILNKFVRVFPESPLVTFPLAQAAMNLTQLPDIHERTQFTTFLRCYHDTHPAERVRFLGELAGRYTNLLEGIALPFCAPVLVSLFGYIVSRASSPMAMDLARFYINFALPLIGFPQLALFQTHLSQLIATVLPNNPAMVLPTLRALESHWTATNGDKQLLVLELLLSICAKLPPAMLAQFARKLFVFLAACLTSPYAKVVQRILLVCINAAPGDWIAVNAKTVITEMIDNVVWVSEKYWEKSVAEKAVQALAALAKIDKALYQKLRTQQKQMKSVKGQSTYVANDCQRYWYEIAEGALDAYSDFNLNAKKHEIYALFHNEKPEARVPSHFITGYDAPDKKKKGRG
jgi:hypothetical protein